MEIVISLLFLLQTTQSFAVTALVKLAIVSCFSGSTTASTCNTGECLITAGITSSDDQVLCNKSGSLSTFPNFTNCATEIMTFTVL